MLPLLFGRSVIEHLSLSIGSRLQTRRIYTKRSIISFRQATLLLFLMERHSLLGLCCGAGGTFKSHPGRTTKWSLSCGRGTNTKAELLGLWTTLLLASSWSLDHLQVIGDSKVIIDWINGSCHLHSFHVEGWKHKTRLLARSFTDISFRHLPRSFNSEADALSKRALRQVVGRLSIFHCDQGLDSPHTFYNLFEA
jgi:ribonuclease HI